MVSDVFRQVRQPSPLQRLSIAVPGLLLCCLSAMWCPPPCQAEVERAGGEAVPSWDREADSTRVALSSGEPVAPSSGSLAYPSTALPTTVWSGLNGSRLAGGSAPPGPGSTRASGEDALPRLQFASEQVPAPSLEPSQPETMKLPSTATATHAPGLDESGLDESGFTVELPFISTSLLSDDAALGPESPEYWHEIGKDTKLASSWNNGLQHQSADRAFRVHVGGRLHSDYLFWSAGDAIQYAPGGVGPLSDAASFRRARIRVNGTLYRNVTWLMEYGFETGVPAFFDVYGELTDLPYVGSVRVGHFREPFSMDALTSGNFLTLMERSLIHDAFVPFRNTGIQAARTLADDSVTVAIGGFRANSNQVGADSQDGNSAITGRVTWNPWYAEEGAYALHFGLAGSSRSPSRLDVAGRPLPSGPRRLRFASRPELRVDSPNFVDTGFFEASHLNLAGAEFALGAGPFLLQAEYNWGFVDNATVGGVTADNALFQGFYAQGSWFLTGESRPYLRQQGVFGQTRPHENFFCVKSEHSEHPAFHGRGAWQLAIRYSYLDLNSEPVRGGRLSDLTCGLNWWLNPNCRWMWNFVLADRDAANPASSGYAGGFASRFQVDF